MSSVQRASTVVQVVRNARTGTGVGNVALNLDACLRRRGYTTWLLTARSIKMNLSDVRFLPWRLSHALEVVAFSLVSPACVFYLRKIHRNAVFISHNDCVAGDIYINHGLHRELIFPTDGRPRIRVLLRNPLHIFMLFREEIRHRVGANRAIVNFSKFGEDEMKRHYDLRSATTAVIPNGIDLQEYYCDIRLGERVRSSFGISGAHLVLGFVGNEFERKGLTLVAEALAALPGHVCVIAVGGTEKMIKKAASDARQLGVSERLFFVGKKNDLLEYYSAFDLMLLPSKQEAWPLVLLEAMACGVPCVATAVSSVPEFVKDDVNGYLVDRQTTDIVRAVSQYLSLSGLDVAQMRENARSTAEQYSWQTVSQRYNALIQSMLEAS